MSDSSSPVTDAIYVGIDVAKQSLDLAIDDQQDVRRLTNDPAGIAALLQVLMQAKPAVIVIESTARLSSPKSGGLERPLLEALLDQQLPVALVHPGRVRYFAKGLGILAKTDRIDASVLRRFGQLASPRLLAKRSANQTELRDLVLCRRQLLVTRTQQSNRRQATASKAARSSIDAIILALNKQLQKLDKRIADLIDADDDFKHLDGLLKSVPGVGAQLSAALTAELPELGQGRRQRLGALAGVAPFARDSGPVKGKRSIRGGRTGIRCVLYMASLCAIRCNPVIKAFADRLRQAGKPPKVVITACMRKLLSLLHVMVRDDLPWNQLNVVRKLATNS